jgi:CubicO group peptidase (beta-lactamase class C family)
VIYSDLGFITLGFLLEKLSGTSLDALEHKEIFAPLKLSTACFNPDARWRERIAASEAGNIYEREMHRQGNEPAADDLWREHLIWGEVHDGNAHFLGGVAGHAGLFATAFETYRLAEQFIAQTSQLLSPETCALFTANLTPGLNEARSVSWQLALTENSTAGPDLPPLSFGHTGFTGTSCWIDSERARIFILLTNRTHDHAPPFVNINSVRRRFHSLAVAALG